MAFIGLEIFALETWLESWWSYRLLHAKAG